LEAGSISGWVWVTGAVLIAIFAAGFLYALWAAADLLIVAGFDAGWAVRLVPNQLYYAWYVPFVYWRFFSSRYAATSSSTHASR